MPISLDTFQRTLDTSKLQGFVKLSEDGTGVKSVGGGFFARHFGLYTKPTAEENNAVRREFYQSVVNTFQCQGEVLDRLRQDLGIDADGNSTSGERLSVGDAKAILGRVKAVADEQSANVKERKALLDRLGKEGFLQGAIRQLVSDKLGIGNDAVAKTKLESADAHDIRRYAMDLTANRDARTAVYEQLKKQGLCQGDVGKHVRDMLDLDDPEKVLEPLPRNVRETVIEFAKDSSAAVSMERIREMKLPDSVDLEDHVAPKHLHECKMILLDIGATEDQLAKVVKHVNHFSITAEHESWSAEAGSMLAKLSAELDIDCSQLRDSLVSGIEEELKARYDSADSASVVSREQMRSDFSAALEKAVNARMEMGAILESAEAGLPPAVTEYLRDALASNVDFNSPDQMKALTEHHDAAVPLHNLLFADSVSETDFYDALATMRDKTGTDMVDTMASRELCKMFCDIGRIVSEAENGAPTPKTDQLMPMMKKHVSQLHFVWNQIKHGGDFCCGPSALARGIDADLMRMYVFAGLLGTDLRATKPAMGQDRIFSPLFERQLSDYGISRVNKHIDNGQHFDVTLRSAFQEAMLKSCRVSLAMADKGGDMPLDFKTTFEQCFKDYTRPSTGLKVGDVIVARPNEIPDAEHRAEVVQGMADKLEQFFGEDKVNGMRAARVISSITHQGFLADVLSSISSSGEPMPHIPISDSAHIMDFTVQRGEDGSYNIHFTGISQYRMMPNETGIQLLDVNRSSVGMEIDLKLSFDAGSGAPSISFIRPPTMSGQFTPLGGLGPENVSRLVNIRDPVDYSGFMDVAELSGALHDPDIRHALFETEETEANEKAALELLRERCFTGADIKLLHVLGYDWPCLEQMLSGMAGDESAPKFEKEIIGRLLDPSTRAAAMQDLKAIATPIVERGWMANVPDISPDILNLVTVAGLSTTSFDASCDAIMVANYIRDSPELDVEMLPADLQHPDPKVVNVAKQQVHQIATKLRQERGLKLLCSHILGVTGTDIELIQKHVPASRYQHLLQHIVERDEYMDSAIRAFKDIVESVRILDSAMKAQQQH